MLVSMKKDNINHFNLLTDMLFPHQAPSNELPFFKYRRAAPGGVKTDNCPLAVIALFGISKLCMPIGS